MRKNAFRRITVWCITAALALSLSVPAFAGEEESPIPVVEPAAQTEAPAAEPAETTVEAGGTVLYLEEDFQVPPTSEHESIEEISSAAQEETAPDPAASEEEAAPEEACVVSENTADAEATEAPLLLNTESEESTTQDTEDAASSLKVGDVTLGTENDGSAWVNNSGWYYTGGEVNTITLVNCDSDGEKVDLTAVGTGINISAAGFNHIGTLYADGDVNITGSGIFLIDSIDMLAGTQINLLTNTEMYTDGSAAVFLLNEEDGCYYLINGSVPGILDENYTLPENIHLVIPANTGLDMRVTDVVKTVNEDGEIEQHYGIREGDDIGSYGNGSIVIPPESIKTKLEVFFPSLTISKDSSLTVASDATVKLGTTGYTGEMDVKDVCRIIVDGVLNLLGRITGTHATDSIPEVTIEGNGVISGSGVISAVDVECTSEAENCEINLGDQARLIVRGRNPAKVTLVEGNVSILYSSGASLEELVLPEQASEGAALPSLTLIPFYNPYASFTINGSVSGSTDCIAQTLNLIFNAEGQLLLEQDRISETKDYRHVDPETGVTWVSFGAYSYEFGYGSPSVDGGSHGGKYALAMETKISQKGDSPTSVSLDQSSYTFRSLLDAILDDDGNDSGDDATPIVGSSINNDLEKKYALRVYLRTENGVEAVFLNKASGDTEIQLSSIIGVDLLEVTEWAAPMPTNGAVSVSGSNTGSGILGGSNAGVLTGGGAVGVLPGTRQPATPTPEPEPEPEPEPVPDASAPVAPIVVKITGTGTHLTAQATQNGVALKVLKQAVKACFRADIPDDWDSDALFAVFYDAKGEPVAVKLAYDALTDSYTMLLPELGAFDIVCLKWSGNDYSFAEFITALKQALKNNT